jgi:hypothetical protein
MKENGISEAMRLEEEQMEQKRQQEQAKRDEEMAQERQKDVAGGEQVVDKKFKALEFLLNQSKVRSTPWYFYHSIDCSNYLKALLYHHAFADAETGRRRGGKG